MKKVGPNKTKRYVGSFEDHVTDGVQVKHIRIGQRRIATRVVGGLNAGTFYTHGDHLSSLNVLTNSTGTEVQRLTYRPFGETDTNLGSVDFDQHRYTGQEQDPETGLYYYRARYYNPVLSRFISPDSIVPEPGKPQSLNRYSYVLNNPTTLVDPNGHYDSDPDGDVSEGGDAPGATGLSGDNNETGEWSGSPKSETPTAPAIDVTDWTASMYETPPSETLDTVRVTGRPVPDLDEPGQVIERTLYGTPPDASLSPAVSPALAPLGLGGSLGGLRPGVGPPSFSTPPAPFSPALGPPAPPGLTKGIDSLYTKALVGTIAIALGVVAPAVTNVGIQTAIQGFGMIGPTVGVVGSIAGLTVGVVGVGVAITGIGIAVVGIAAMAYSVRNSSSDP